LRKWKVGMDPVRATKRRTVMRRSMALGHCVCDPKKPCPCDVFKRMNVCECAGERLPRTQEGETRLTQAVRKAGCSSKVPKRELLAALAGLPKVDDPRVIVGSAAGDDAGVVRLPSGGDTVLTVDVFSPSVDDPYTFGEVAAANSVSDVYAMGGTPEAALSVIGFPIDVMPPEVMGEILRGGVDKMREAGVVVVGGHSINDEELKFGFAVSGRVSAEGLVRNSGALPGDAIVLTKPLGVGIVSFANQIDRATPESVEAVASSMTRLNCLASERMVARGAHAATDVTGFSLLGHMAEVVKTSGVEVEIDFDALPLFEGVGGLARAEVLPGAVERNREAVDESLLDLSALAPAQASVLFCPETSGGLLVFLPAKEAGRYVEELRAGGDAAAVVIGRVVAEREGGLIRALTSRADEFSPIKLERKATPAPASESEPSADLDCCASPPGAAPSGGAVIDGGEAPSLPDEIERAFAAYMRSVNSPGALDAKAKKLISLALSVLAKCEPCVDLNAKAAREAGASEEEIGEAAALGIAFGGAPVAMFYKGTRARAPR